MEGHGIDDETVQLDPIGTPASRLLTRRRQAFALQRDRSISGVNFLDLFGLFSGGFHDDLGLLDVAGGVSELDAGESLEGHRHEA